MKRHWSIWQGTVRAEVRGGEPERFLNACTEAGLVLRNIEYTAPQTLNISLPAEDRDRMERIARLSTPRVCTTGNTHRVSPMMNSTTMAT